MYAKRSVAAVHYEDGLAVRRDVGEDGFAPGGSAPGDGARPGVNREERVVPRCRRVDALAVRRKIERIGKWPYGNARNDLELHEIDNGHVAVGGGDVSREMQVRPKERWSMLAEQQHNPADSQRGEQEVDAEVFEPVHNIRLSLCGGTIYRAPSRFIVAAAWDLPRLSSWRWAS